MSAVHNATSRRQTSARQTSSDRFLLGTASGDLRIRRLVGLQNRDKSYQGIASIDEAFGLVPFGMNV